MAKPWYAPFERQMLYAGVAILLVLFATLLGILSAGPNVHAWDISFGQWIQRWEGSFGQTLYNIGDMLGTTSLAAAITAIALIAAIAVKQTHISIFLLLILLLRLAGTLLKPIFDSPRPSSDYLQLVEELDGTGYPSGHSTTAAMVAAMLVLITWRYLSNTQLQQVATIIAACAIILVGWSRVWAGAHWPSDVLGGWSYGIALVLIAWILADIIATRIALMRDTIAQFSKGSQSTEA